MERQGVLSGPGLRNRAPGRAFLVPRKAPPPREYPWTPAASASSCLKLKGREGAWRLRVGDYRIIYRIENAVLVVLVIEVGHHRDIYG